MINKEMVEKYKDDLDRLECFERFEGNNLSCAEWLTSNGLSYHAGEGWMNNDTGLCGAIHFVPEKFRSCERNTHHAVFWRM